MKPVVASHCAFPLEAGFRSVAAASPLAGPSWSGKSSDASKREAMREAMRDSARCRRIEEWKPRLDSARAEGVYAMFGM